MLAHVTSVFRSLMFAAALAASYVGTVGDGLTGFSSSSRRCMQLLDPAFVTRITTGLLSQEPEQEDMGLGGRYAGTQRGRGRTSPAQWCCISLCLRALGTGTTAQEKGITMLRPGGQCSPAQGAGSQGQPPTTASASLPVGQWPNPSPVIRQTLFLTEASLRGVIGPGPSQVVSAASQAPASTLWRLGINRSSLGEWLWFARCWGSSKHETHGLPCSHRSLAVGARSEDKKSTFTSLSECKRGGSSKPTSNWFHAMAVR